MTSSKYCLKSRNRIKLPNAKKLDNEQDHDIFLSKLTMALCCDNFNKLPLKSSLGRLPLSELAQELKTGNIISKFEDFDYYTEGEDESPYVYTCSFVMAIMYFERLKASNPCYLKSINSSELFLISLLVASKYLHWIQSSIVNGLQLMVSVLKLSIKWKKIIYLQCDEEFTTRHKQIVNQLYGDMQNSNSVLFKMFLLISSVVRTIRRLYRRKLLRHKIKQMIAMSTVITVVTATTMKLKINSDSHKLVQELYKQIESDHNYPMIPSTNLNQIVNAEHKINISIEWHSSKLAQLLDHLLLMNTCMSGSRQTLYPTTFKKTHRNQFRNITYFKSIIFFDYLTTECCKS